jgi:SnoaL-like polyketide cyclase
MIDRREFILAVGAVAVATDALAGETNPGPRLSGKEENTLSEPTVTRELYEGFQRVQFDRWDPIIADDVLINSPAGRDIRGLKVLKDFATQFTDLGYRIDLIDEHLAVDQQGDGRGFITFMLNWKHTKNFGGLAPTGREGTSVETMLLTIRRHKIVRIDVADNTLDLAIYEWERGWPIPHNVRPEPIVVGIDRRTPQ